MLTAGSPYDQLMLMDLLPIYNTKIGYIQGLPAKRPDICKLKARLSPSF